MYRPGKPFRPTNVAEELYRPMAHRDNDKEWRRDKARCTVREDLLLRIGDRLDEVPAHAINAGPEALCINCRMAIEPHTRIRLRRADSKTWCNARVIHCTRTFSGYKIGLIMTTDDHTPRIMGMVGN